MTDENWQRLGRLLMERRVELGYSNRTRFAAEKGFRNTRVLAAIENAERTNFDATTLTSIELAYAWRVGSIENVLAGKEPWPSEDPPVPGASGNPTIVEVQLGAGAKRGSFAQITDDEHGQRVIVGQLVRETGRLELRFWPTDSSDTEDVVTMSRLVNSMRAAFDALDDAGGMDELARRRGSDTDSDRNDQQYGIEGPEPPLSAAADSEEGPTKRQWMDETGRGDEDSTP